MQSEHKEKLFVIVEELSFPQKAQKLFEHQIDSWPLASGGYASLNSVEIKIFDFDDFTIEAHFNPGRIISSSAKVDTKSISERPCFLCYKNLPPEQKGIELFDDYLLLVNPFPIFHKHFTIPTKRHIPQQIKTEIKSMLEISSLLGKDYSVFYNGPKCGASAPDHLHFQAGEYGFMKIDRDYERLSKRKARIIFESDDIKVSLVTNCLRNFIAIESNDSSSMADMFSKIYTVLSNGNNEEPLMNLICNYNGTWRLMIFPRSKHRPTYFFEEDEKKILISPAAVDMGGVLIFPREEDFEKVTRELIVDVFSQVTFSNEYFSEIESKILNA